MSPLRFGPQREKRARNVAAVLATRTTAHARKPAAAQWGTATLFVIPAFLLLFAAVSRRWTSRCALRPQPDLRELE